MPLLLYSLVATSNDYVTEAIAYLKNKAKTLNYIMAQGLLLLRTKKSSFSLVELFSIHTYAALHGIVQLNVQLECEPMKSKLYHGVANSSILPEVVAILW